MTTSRWNVTRNKGVLDGIGINQHSTKTKFTMKNENKTLCVEISLKPCFLIAKTTTYLCNKNEKNKLWTIHTMESKLSLTSCL